MRMTDNLDAQTLRLAREMSGDLEPVDRGPLTEPAELTEQDWNAADIAYKRDQQARDARRLSETVQAELVLFRAEGLI